MKGWRASLLIAAVSSSAGAYAAPRPEAPRPEIFKKLTDCRKIADSRARLACYDAQVGALDEAETRKEVVIVSRDEVKKARRSLFGLTLPNLAVFGRGDGDDGSDSEIQATIAGASQMSNGRWSIVLDDGARWVQSDSRELIEDAKAGDKIRIRRAAMGSYLANVNKQVAIRVHRVND